MRFIAFLLLLPLLSGCLSPARQLDASAVAQIKAGTSTRTEVEQQFGKPQELLVGSNHKTVAEYSLMIDSPPSPNLQRVFCLRTLSVLYGPNDIVEKMIHHESSKTLEWRVTGASIGSHMKTDWIKERTNDLKRRHYVTGATGYQDADAGRRGRFGMDLCEARAGKQTQCGRGEI